MASWVWLGSAEHREVGHRGSTSWPDPARVRRAQRRYEVRREDWRWRKRTRAYSESTASLLRRVRYQVASRHEAYTDSRSRPRWVAAGAARNDAEGMTAADLLAFTITGNVRVEHTAALRR